MRIGPADVLPVIEASARRRQAIDEAASHLRCILIQAVPSDDKLLLEHVKQALNILEREVKL